jgi:hypothetical protein
MDRYVVGMPRRCVLLTYYRFRRGAQGRQPFRGTVAVSQGVCEKTLKNEIFIAENADFAQIQKKSSGFIYSGFFSAISACSAVRYCFCLILSRFKPKGPLRL